MTVTDDTTDDTGSDTEAEVASATSSDEAPEGADGAPSEAALAAAAEGRLHLLPRRDNILRMSEVQAAHRRMESNATFGKIVLEWS